MISLPLPTAGAAILPDLREIGRRLKAESPADTVACAFGASRDVRAWYDDSDGRYFDLASLTKPLFTAPTALDVLSATSGLDEPITELLTWLPRSAARTTVRRLLTHAAGLPAELPATGDVSEVRRWLAARLGEAPTEEHQVLYSDAGYWLLGGVISKLTGEPLHATFAKAATAAAGGFRFGQVPTELAVAAGPRVYGEQLPHDPAARRLGASGHAGAFGTLAGVVRAVVSWLDHAWLTEPVSTQAVTCQTHTTPGGHRSLAWTLAGDPHHVVAHDWPPTTLSHTGFTGVCVALDPVSRWWAVYLSNALPVERDATPVLKARRLFHASAATHLRAAVPDPS